MSPELPEQDPIEPAVDPDSPELLADAPSETPHPASRFDAGTGQGTTSGPPQGTEFLEHPIMDGSTENFIAEAAAVNPNRGESDPAQISHQPALGRSSTNRWLFASLIAVVVVCVGLFLLLPWNPLLCGLGIVFALVMMLAMVTLRATRVGLKARLRADAILLALIWLVPLGIIITVLVTSADEIW